MVEVFIDDIDFIHAQQIKGIYMIATWDRVYIGKSKDILRRLKQHNTTTFKGEHKRMFIIEAYENISNLDLMIMEDFYICKFEALGYNLENKADAIPPRIRKFLRGGSKFIGLKKQFKECFMASSIYRLEVHETKAGYRVYMAK